MVPYFLPPMLCGTWQGKVHGWKTRCNLCTLMEAYEAKLYMRPGIKRTRLRLQNLEIGLAQLRGMRPIWPQSMTHH